MNNYLIGTDPELFLKKDGILQSAYGLIQGDKQNPFKVKDGAVQVDGMALEFNTDPTNECDVFVHNIASVMAQLKAMVPEYEFFIEPTAQFGKKFIDEQPEEAKEMGCDPDYNAYTGKQNPTPDGNTSFRTGAGHLHIGWTEGEDINDPDHIYECMEVVKQLDAFLGFPAMLFDKDTKRRSMYGKAGAFRPKPYGVEYRTLSNSWLKDPKLQAWVFSNAQLAVDKLVAGKVFYNKWSFKHHINEGQDDEDTRYMCEDCNIPLPPEVEVNIPHTPKVTVIGTPTSFPGNGHWGSTL
ncbi:MAG: hypothetical protein JKY81_02440 [Colwellia sp.]|nr:hypothetical protein [Colwellia sp.]